MSRSKPCANRQRRRLAGLGVLVEVLAIGPAKIRGQRQVQLGGALPEQARGLKVGADGVARLARRLLLRELEQELQLADAPPRRGRLRRA